MSGRRADRQLDWRALTVDDSIIACATASSSSAWRQRRARAVAATRFAPYWRQAWDGATVRPA